MKQQHLLSLLFIILAACAPHQNNGNGHEKQAADSNTTIAAPMAAPPPVMIYSDQQLGERMFNYGKNSPTNVYRYTLGERNAGRDNFEAVFKYQNEQTPLLHPAIHLSIGSINTLLQKIRDLPNNPYQPATSFAACKFHYGLDSTVPGNPKTVIIIEPVLLTPAPVNSIFCDITPSGLYYLTNDAGNLVNQQGQADQPLTGNQMTALTGCYFRNIYIRHFEDENGLQRWGRFIDNNGMKLGDTKFSIMPIQQLFAVYRCNTATFNAADTLCVEMIANDYWVGSSNFKVHTVASYMLTDIPNNDPDAVYERMAADFAQMCPPHCTGKTQVPKYNSQARVVITEVEGWSKVHGAKTNLAKPK